MPSQHCSFCNVNIILVFSITLFVHSSVHPGSLPETFRGSVLSLVYSYILRTYWCYCPFLFLKYFFYYQFRIYYNFIITAASIITMLLLDIHNHSTSLYSIGPKFGDKSRCSRKAQFTVIPLLWWHGCWKTSLSCFTPYHISVKTSCR